MTEVAASPVKMASSDEQVKKDSDIENKETEKPAVMNGDSKSEKIETDASDEAKTAVPIDETNPSETMDVGKDVDKDSADVSTDKKPVVDAEKEKPCVDALTLFSQGKRHLMCGEAVKAVNVLQESCRLLAEEHGETGDDLGEAYLTYGTALLDVARMESGVLGNALDGMSEEDETDEKEKDATNIETDQMTEEEREKISDEIIDALTNEDRNPSEDSTTKVKEHDKDEDKNKSDNASGESNESEMEQEDKNIKENDNVDQDEDKNKSDNASGESKESEMKSTEQENKDIEENDKSEKKDGEKKDKSDDPSDESKENKMESTEQESEKRKDEEKIVILEEGTEGQSEDMEEEEEETENDEAENEEAPEENDPNRTQDEDVTNLQLAWEILELSKVIFERQTNEESKLKLAESHLKLGEVSLESDRYDDAIKDFEMCLKIQCEHLEKDSRLIAESHYQIGVACNLAQRYEMSLEHLKSAVNVIRVRISKNEEKVKAAEDSKKELDVSNFECPIYKAKKEIDDLKSILPDILAKIEDTEDEMRGHEKMAKMVKESLCNKESETIGFGVTDTNSKKTETTSDISHMIRKKRKPEEVEETAKKTKLEENTPNGTHVNGN